MLIPRSSGLWMTALLSALAISTLGCVAAPPSPTQDQKWMTVDEFTRQWPMGELGDIPRPWPVLVLPEGSEIPVRFCRGEVGALALAEDGIFPLKARKSVYVNLETFTASTDKVKWSSMEEVLWPVKSVTCSLIGREGKSEVMVFFWGRY